MPISELDLIKAEEKKSSSKEDLDSLLKLAEELKENCEHSETEIEQIKNRALIRAGISFMVVCFLGTLTIYVLIFFATSETYKNSILPIGALITITLGAITAAITADLYSKKVKILRKKISLDNLALKLDNLALKEVLQLLRETSSITADVENWSVLARAEFRIRLSRFKLDEEKSDDYRSQTIFDFLIKTITGRHS